MFTKRIGKPQKSRRAHRLIPISKPKKRDGVNLPPENIDSQHVPRGISELFNPRITHRKRRRPDFDNSEEASTEHTSQKKKPKPKKSQPNSHMKDLDDAVQDAKVFAAHSHSIFTTTDNKEKGETKRQRRHAKLKEKKQQKLLQKKLRDEEDEADGLQRDTFVFGEVVQAPPKLPKLRKSAPKPVTFMPKSSCAIPPASFGKDVTPAKQKIVEEERAKVIAKYRELKLLKVTSFKVMAFKSLFADKGHAVLYKSFRPAYSENIFSYIFSTLKKWPAKTNFSVALDVGCGSGQATQHLHPVFDYVIGMDVSASQLNEAKADNVCDNHGDFLLATDAKIPLKDSSFSYIQVFQAAHWFNLPRFYSEVDHLLVPGGTLLLSVYGTASMRAEDNAEFVKAHGEDKIKSFNKDFRSFYELLIANKYFPPKIREDVDSLYANYTLPYKDQIRCYDERMYEKRSIDSWVGYMSSWSGWQQYCKKTGDKQFLENLEKKWKADFGDRVMVFSFPVGLLFSRKPL